MQVRPVALQRNVTVPANSEIFLSVVGAYVFVRESNQTEFQLAFDEAQLFAVQLKDKIRVPPGFDFEKLRVANPNGTTLIASLLIGTGDFDNLAAEIAGVLPVVSAGNGMAVSTVSVGTAAAQLLAANADRTSALINAGALDLYIGPDNTVTTGTGWRIPAGGDLPLAHKGAIWGIRATGTGHDAKILSEVQ